MTLHAHVIGDPIAQSKSPLIHRHWIEQLGLEADYKGELVPPAQLASYLAASRADPTWRGCNVTIPHKIAIMDLVEDPGDVRTTIGAMNAVLRQADGKIIGTNTDAAGFVAPIADLDLDGQPVAVIGAGGAAHAVLFALAKMGVGSVTLQNRSPLKGAALLARFGLKGEVKPLGASLPPVALLINASPLGMTGQPPLPIDLAQLPDNAVVYDLVYAPLETELLASARARDLQAVDGLEMLIAQAALAFELFFGVAPPEDEGEVLRKLLTS